jgi:RNA polymerase sigma-70 factor (ECF subfamily)
VQRIADTADGERLANARSMLGRLFGSEPTSSQSIAVMHLVDGMSLDEVVRQVGMSVSGVRKRLRSLRCCGNTISSTPTTIS